MQILQNVPVYGIFELDITVNMKRFCKIEKIFDGIQKAVVRQYHHREVVAGSVKRTISRGVTAVQGDILKGSMRRLSDFL